MERWPGPVCSTPSSSARTMGPATAWSRSIPAPILESRFNQHVVFQSSLLMVYTVSAPSSLAVDVARRFGMAVVGFLRGGSTSSLAASEYPCSGAQRAPALPAWRGLPDDALLLEQPLQIDDLFQRSYLIGHDL